MKKKYIFLIAIIFFLALTTIHAESNDTAMAVSDNLEVNDEPLAVSEEPTLSMDNNTEPLEKSYYYDESEDELYEDDTLVTHNVVKYYGDKDTKFKVKVLGDDYEPLAGVYVSFGKDWDVLKEKLTNSYGNAYFPINYKVGTHNVITYLECDNEDDPLNECYFFAKNKVTIKSTIPTKTLTKYVTQKNKKFAIKFLTTKGKPLKNTKVQIKIKGKTYKVRTNSKGIAYIKINSFKVGKHTITAVNPKSKEKRKITVTIKKKPKVKTVTLKVKNSDYFPSKSINKYDEIHTVYETKYMQYSPGVFVEARYKYGLDNPIKIKLVKAKVWFKNKKTGKIITRTSSKTQGGYDIYFKLIKGYTPYKAKVWYRNK